MGRNSVSFEFDFASWSQQCLENIRDLKCGWCRCQIQQVRKHREGDTRRQGFHPERHRMRPILKSFKYNFAEAVSGFVLLA
mmetsp:Transcript_385/g.658  ORF Transcript_385/g.658 Transcript_385/m.658 type:complete len:81 (+) Transcript_385:1231-1473(+)